MTAMSLEALQADREELLEALRSGVLTVQNSDGRSVTYRRVSELRTALASLDDEISRLQGTGPVRQVRIHSTKGV